MKITDPQKLLSILQKQLGNFKKGSKGEHVFHCPFCNHYKPKLNINIETGNWHCFVDGKGSQNIITLFKEIHAPKSVIKEVAQIVKKTSNNTPPTQKKESNIQIVSLPEDFRPLSIARPSIEYRNALYYLKSRNGDGVSIDQIHRYNIGYCERGQYARRIIIPSYDNMGNVNYFVTRSYYGGRYKNPDFSKDVVLFDLYTSWKLPVILVEGMFDAISIDMNAVPLLGKTVNNSIIQKMIEYKTPLVYLSLDSDAVGNIYNSVMKLLNAGIRTKIILLPDKKDPADLGRQNFLKLIETSTIDTSTSNMLKLKMLATT